MSESQNKDTNVENVKSSNESIGKSIIVKSNGLENSVCSSEPSAFFTPFYTLPKKLSKSLSFNSVDNLQRSEEEEEENTSQKKISIPSSSKLHMQHYLQHRHSMQIDPNFDLSNQTNSYTTNNDLSDNRYKYFINSLNCDTNCSCAYHKNTTRLSKPNQRVQYRHHPYYDHHSFDQNVRFSQTSLNEIEKCENKMLLDTTNKNEENTQEIDQIDEKSSFRNKNEKETQSMFNFGYFEIFSFIAELGYVILTNFKYWLLFITTGFCFLIFFISKFIVISIFSVKNIGRLLIQPIQFKIAKRLLLVLLKYPLTELSNEIEMRKKTEAAKAMTDLTLNSFKKEPVYDAIFDFKLETGPVVNS